MSGHAPRATTTGAQGRRPTVLVMGAGQVGCWLGGWLQAVGAKVYFVGRPRVLRGLHQQGLTLTDVDGSQVVLQPSTLRLREAVPAGRRPDLVLLCVKASATTEAAAALNAALPAGTLVLAMQSGISTADQAQAAAPNLVLLRALVPFHLTEQGPGRLCRTGSDQLSAQTHMGLLPWLPWFTAAGLPLSLHTDMLPLQWGQLLLNLNQAVQALSGLPLRSQLMDSHLRACTAALIGETLFLMGLAGIRPARLGPVRPTLLPHLLRLPKPLFRLAGRRLLHGGALASSSMADDLVRQRPTEIDAFQGEVLRLAASLGKLAPINARMTQLIRSWSPRHPTMAGLSMRKQLGA